MIGVMAFLHAIAMLLNYYLQYLKDEQNNSLLQKVIFVVTAVLHLLSFPVLAVSFWISNLYFNRQEKRIRRETWDKYFNELTKLHKEIDELENDRKLLSREQFERGKSMGYKEGYNAAKLDAKELTEHERITAYRSGYQDGQHDYPLGIDLTKETEE